MSDLRALGESVANAVVERVGRGFGRVQERKPIPYDLLESDDSYLVVFDAAGVSKSDVQVRFVDTEVQIRIDRFRDFHDGFEMRFPGRGLSLDSTAKLPDDASVDAEAATATVTKHGTLQVYIPKTAEGKDVAVEDEEDTTDMTNEDTDDDPAAAETNATASTESMVDEDAATDDGDTAAEPAEAAEPGTSEPDDDEDDDNGK
jgi:HSP20 family molecular chaperone IbpA